MTVFLKPWLHCKIDGIKEATTKNASALKYIFNNIKNFLFTYINKMSRFELCFLFLMPNASKNWWAKLLYIPEFSHTIYQFKVTIEHECFITKFVTLGTWGYICCGWNCRRKALHSDKNSRWIIEVDPWQLPFINCQIKICVYCSSLSTLTPFKYLYAFRQH